MSSAKNPPFPIVGIGTSAGGVEALETFFHGMPAESGMGFVIVTHLAPDRESLLQAVIGRYTPMPVHVAADGEPVLPNNVYVIPANSSLGIHGGRLRVQPAEGRRWQRAPVDHFFSTLAEDRGEYAIAIVLSGGGSDGTLGVKAIKERGGLTLAQVADHSSPQYSAMPQSAIATGLIDLALPVDEMAARLLDYVKGLGALEELIGRRPSRGESAAIATRDAICELLLKQTGHDFREYKPRTFLRRIHRRMQIAQVSTLDAYLEKLRQSTREVNLLFQDLLIGVTSFFRDADAFEALDTQVIPRLLEGRGAGDVLRVWVPGCATGEEVYSIGILLREHLDRAQVPVKVQIFATDIDESALAVARAGRYPATMLDNVSPERRERFFSQESGSYVVAKSVRDLCIFSPHSVIRDPPFSRMDLVSCRNLLIYLSPEAQQKVLPVFHYALKPGGYLFLGTAENVSQASSLFTPLDKKLRIFQSRDQINTPRPLPMFVAGLHSGAGGRAHFNGHFGNGGVPLRHLIEGRVLEVHSPAHVVVNRDSEIVYYSGRTGKYLEPAQGAPTGHLLAMARRGLRLELRDALRQAAETHLPVVRENINVEVDDRLQPVTLTVEPLATDRGGSEPLFLVVFTDVGKPLPVQHGNPESRPAAVPDGTAEQVDRELRETRERLQSTVEEYETALEELKSSNEELVSLNEELQSANEELETSKEELQSVNEELHTVNSELTGKLEELEQVHSDLKNLFDSTRLATIFLDRDKVIRSFTPAASQVFSLIPSDRGRPLSDISTRLDYPEMHADIAEVLATAEPREKRVRARQGGAHFLVRLLPYRTLAGKIDGVVMNFLDVTAVVLAEERERLLAELNHRVKNMLAVIVSIATQSLRRAASPEDFAGSFLDRLHALARSHELLSRNNWTGAHLEELIRQELSPYMLDHPERVAISGPSLPLNSKAAVSLAMSLHELATNAAKYGALSVDSGRVAVTWNRRDTDGSRLVLDWQESGGPEVKEPERQGFGLTLLKAEIGHGLGGEVETRFEPGGLAVHITVPLDVAEAGSPGPQPAREPAEAGSR